MEEEQILKRKEVENTTFEDLWNIDVSDKTEEKNGLTYLSWAWAVKIMTDTYEDWEYEIERFEGKPYVYDELAGYMVFTKVRVKDKTKEMWLPVMDSNNKAMLNHEYTYKTKRGEYKVEPATMFDINKTIMRCLTKNMAMFGLGLKLYIGEDLPDTPPTLEEAEKYKFTFGKYEGKTIKEVQEERESYLDWVLENGKDERVKQMIELVTNKQVETEDEVKEKIALWQEVSNLINETDTDLEKLLAHYEVKTNTQLTLEQLKDCKKTLEKKLAKCTK